MFAQSIGVQRKGNTTQSACGRRTVLRQASQRGVAGISKNPAAIEEVDGFVANVVNICSEFVRVATARVRQRVCPLESLLVWPGGAGQEFRHPEADSAGDRRSGIRGIG